MSETGSIQRRRILLALGLAGGAWLAPSLTGHGLARASEGSGGGSGGASAPSRPAPPAPRPEVLLLTQGPVDIALREAGYFILQSRQTSGGHLYRLRAPAGLSARRIEADLAQRFPGSLPAPNTLYRAGEFVCSGAECAAHAAVSWPPQATGKGLRIGMIDTGINPEHEALRGSKLRLLRADPGERPAAGRRHGTAIAALLIGQRGSPAPGLLPEAELVAVDAFHRLGSGEAADAYTLSEAVDLLIDEGVSVLNLSFEGAENPILHRALRRAAEHGIALVAAAGNGGAGAAPAYPAAWPEVVAVTATDVRGRAWRQANQGAYIRFAAPGVRLWTAASVSGGRLKSGTSFAAPFVTAALALRIDTDPAKTLEQHLSDLEHCAEDLGVPGRDDVFGAGLISMELQCLA